MKGRNSFIKKSRFYPQVELLLNVLPIVAKEKCFALKGGTAINLFNRDMPRLSVDIDLTYLLPENRETAQKGIAHSLGIIAQDTIRLLPGLSVREQRSRESNTVTRLQVVSSQAEVKIEPNTVLRRTVYPTEIKTTCNKVENEFGTSVTAQLASFADIFGGKICAALDRQHPRDLFDIKLLLENEGLTDEVRKAFVIYLVSHNRPPDELLKPTRLDIRQTFETQFRGMTTLDILVSELEEAREKLISKINSDLAQTEREFLASIFKGKPQWDILEIEHISELPAIQWKLHNIEKMSSQKRKAALEKLEDVLSD